MDNIYKYEEEKGFTLVELLAVIVILAIIMIIAIPAVLQTMQSARRKTFVEYIDKAVNQSQNKLTEEQVKGNSLSGCVIFNVKEDLDFSSTGSFDGYVLINTVDSNIYVTLHDDENMIVAYKYGSSDSEDKIEKYSSTDERMNKEYICSQVSDCLYCTVKSDTKDANGNYVYEIDESSVKTGSTLIDGKNLNMKLKSLSMGKEITGIALDENVKEIRFSNDIKSEYMLISTEDSPYPAYAWFEDGILYLGSSQNELIFNEDSNWALGGFTKATAIDLSHFNFQNVKNASHIFSYDEAVTSLDLTKFKGVKFTDTSGMFCYCQSLKSIDLSNLDTSNVTDMNNMFNNINAVTSLDFSNFNTGNVTNMAAMFYKANLLTTLDLSHFDTKNVTSMYSMFDGMSSLTSLNISSFDTSKVEEFVGMFSACKKLKTINMGAGFKTSRASSMEGMFYSCSVLSNLDVSNFNTSNVTNMNSMFAGCGAIESLDLNSWDTSKVTIMSAMFNNMAKLKSLKLSNWNTKSVKSMDYLFAADPLLAEADTSNWDLSSLTNAQCVFSYAKKMTKIKFGEGSFKQKVSLTRAFQGCALCTEIDISSLENFTLSGTFNGCTAVDVIYVNNNYTGTMNVPDSNCKTKTFTKKEA